MERFDCEVWRPLLTWSYDDVIEIHQAFGIKPNPLYLKGAERVGCCCWEWSEGRFASGGYGQFWDGKPVRAHRFSWEFFNGPIPKGLCVLHSCDNPPCVNPLHLSVGTRAENNRDMRSKGRGFVPPPRRGEAYPMARLTAEDVRSIRASDERPSALASRYGVSPAHVTKIRKREAWRV